MVLNQVTVVVFQNISGRLQCYKLDWWTVCLCLQLCVLLDGEHWRQACPADCVSATCHFIIDSCLISLCTLSQWQNCWWDDIILLFHATLGLFQSCSDSDIVESWCISVVRIVIYWHLTDDVYCIEQVVWLLTCCPAHRIIWGSQHVILQWRWWAVNCLS